MKATGPVPLPGAASVTVTGIGVGLEARENSPSAAWVRPDLIARYAQFSRNSLENTSWVSVGRPNSLCKTLPKYFISGKSLPL